MAAFVRSFLSIAAALALTATVAAAPADRTRLPIDIDADFWELDRKADVIRFRGITITQGDLRVRADRADTSAIDFKDAEWVFEGDVRISTQGASIGASEARLRFVDHRLRLATISGSPVEFQQDRGGAQGPTSGRANVLEYDLDSDIVRMNGEAWLSEGSNEIQGHTITYDIAAQRVVANAAPGGTGRVRITVTPEGDVTTNETPDE